MTLVDFLLSRRTFKNGQFPLQLEFSMWFSPEMTFRTLIKIINQEIHILIDFQ